MANIDRFLDVARELWAQTPEEFKEEEGPRPGPLGAAYQALTSSLGLPCPPELVLLGDELAAGRVACFPWELLTPDEAASQRQEFQKWADTQEPCMRPKADMLPLFGSDGSCLLLDRDGAIWPWSHEIAIDDMGCVARSLDELLGKLVDGPELEPQTARSEGEFQIDGIRYRYSIGHGCPPDASSKKERCQTSLIFDLAPHVNRPPGSHLLMFRFPEPPLERARTQPFRLVTTPRGVVDLGRREVLTALLEIGRARGWTGRAGPLDLGDATPLLDGLS